MDKAAEYWGRQHANEALTQRGMNWLENPIIQAHINERVSGDPQVDWIDHAARTQLAGQWPLPRILSLGCGEGKLERALAERGFFQHCDASDLSPGSISIAKARAEAAGFNHIEYGVVDTNTIVLPPANYHAIWIEAALHHFHALEHVCAQMQQTLKPGGMLFLNEYVGPTQFQFTPRQKQAIQAAFDLIPAPLRKTVSSYVEEAESRAGGNNGLAWMARRSWDKLRDGDLLPALRRRLNMRRAQQAGSTFVRQQIDFPSPRDVLAADPSEAVRSADILPVLQQHFEILEMKPMGGTLLQYLLGGIAGNFAPANPGSMAVLQALIQMEDALIDCGDLQSDFVYIAAKPLPQFTP